MGGEPRLEGRRITVIQVADLVLEGDYSPERVADQFDLSLGEVYSALAYYFEHPDEIRRVRERHRELEAELKEASLGPPQSAKV